MKTRVIVGVAAVVGVLAAALVAPQTVGWVLIWFSFLVALIAFLGFIDPGIFGFSDRQAPVWLVAVSIGLFVGGGVILAPPDEVVVSSDLNPNERRVVRIDPEVSMLSWRDGPWPFTVSDGRLVCYEVGGQEAAFVAAPESDQGGYLGTGTGWAVWPLNGVASMHHARFGAEPSLNPIWAPDPLTGLRVNIGPMIVRARELCR